MFLYSFLLFFFSLLLFCFSAPLPTGVCRMLFATCARRGRPLPCCFAPFAKQHGGLQVFAVPELSSFSLRARCVFFRGGALHPFLRARCAGNTQRTAVWKPGKKTLKALWPLETCNPPDDFCWKTQKSSGNGRPLRAHVAKSMRHTPVGRGAKKQKNVAKSMRHTPVGRGAKKQKRRKNKRLGASPRTPPGSAAPWTPSHSPQMARNPININNYHHHTHYTPPRHTNCNSRSAS